MMTGAKTPNLDDLLNEFVAENDQPSAQVLEVWAKRYPEFRRELVDFAAAWAEQLALPPASELSEEEEKALVDRAMSHVLNVAFTRDQQTHTQETDDGPIGSLSTGAISCRYASGST